MKPGTEIVSYTPTRAALADLTSKYKGLVFDVTKPDGMREAKAAKKDITEHRITLERARVAEKAEALAYGKYVDAEAKKIADQLAVLEDPITLQIETETKREQREREEKVRLEAERLAAEEAAKKKAEEEKLAAERAEIARQRAALEAEQKASREKIETEQREARAKIEAEERAAKVLRDTEEAKLKAERDRVEGERRRLEEEARAEQFRKDEEARAVRLEEQRRRDAEENARQAARQEQLRKEADRLDSRRMLETFCQRFDHLHPDLAKYIREYLAHADELKAA